jgi:ribosome modulation factor
MKTWEEGARAAYEGKGDWECPYPVVADVARSSWILGWRAARERVILDRLSQEFKK